MAGVVQDATVTESTLANISNHKISVMQYKFMRIIIAIICTLNRSTRGLLLTWLSATGSALDYSGTVWKYASTLVYVHSLLGFCPYHASHQASNCHLDLNLSLEWTSCCNINRTHFNPSFLA